jgi:cytochrome b561
MQFKNTPAAYGAVTKTFHWTLAALVVGMLCLGLYMSDLPNGLDKLKLYNLHKSLGACVLFLVLCRIGWHAYSAKPPFVASLKAWEKISARAVHIFLYAAMIGMPLSGWFMSSAAGRSVSVFGLFALPDFVQPDKTLAQLLRETHETLADILIAAICLHVLGALKHHFLDRDATLRRMLPVALLALLAFPAHADIMKWETLIHGSSMTFTQGPGAPVPVSSFDPEVVFEPSHPESSRIILRADLAAAFLPPKFMDDPATRAAFTMAGGRGPVAPSGKGAAVFTSTSIRPQGGGFVMAGTLAMNGRSRSLEAPFELATGHAADGAPQMTLTGAFTFNPQDFADDKLPQPPGVNAVTVDFRLVEIPAG